MLSAAPPTITDVAVSSTDWTSAFVSHLESNGLGSGGYSIPVGSSDQLNPLSWGNIDQIRITFSEDVHVDAADLSLSGVSQASYSFSDFRYTPEERLAVWTLDAPLASDRYWIDLDADGLNPVTDRSGTVLDGDWTNSVSAYASGNGVAGGDFEFAFNVLPGDALGIDLLEYNNLFEIYLREGLSVGDPSYSPYADVDGDGQIEPSDWDAVYSHLYESTPAGTPTGATNDAPTTSGIATLSIDDSDGDVAISLFNAFDDAEDSDAQLTFSVTENSSPSLFDTVQLNQATGELTVNAGTNAVGRARLTVAATDSSGLTTETEFIIDVGRQNVAPTITSTPNDLGNGIWLIEGWVTDPDDQLDDMWVVIEGDFINERVSVGASGYYFLAVAVAPGQIDTLSVYTADRTQGSNTALIQVG